jgi:hypothetical protein
MPHEHDGEPPLPGVQRCNDRLSAFQRFHGLSLTGIASRCRSGTDLAHRLVPKECEI